MRKKEKQEVDQSGQRRKTKAWCLQNGNDFWTKLSYVSLSVREHTKCVGIFLFRLATVSVDN